MIHPAIKEQLCHSIEELMIPVSNVANVIDSHNLSTGMLILSQVRYSLIPVLSVKDKLQGLLSMSMIINSVMTVDRIEYDRLDEMKVSDVMLSEPVRLTLEHSFEEVLQALIDQNFVCIVNNCEESIFLGIITRKAILQRLTHFLHETGNERTWQALIAKWEEI